MIENLKPTQRTLRDRAIPRPSLACRRIGHGAGIALIVFGIIILCAGLWLTIQSIADPIAMTALLNPSFE